MHYQLNISKLYLTISTYSNSGSYGGTLKVMLKCKTVHWNKTKRIYKYTYEKTIRNNKKTQESIKNHKYYSRNTHTPALTRLSSQGLNITF